MDKALFEHTPQSYSHVTLATSIVSHCVRDEIQGLHTVLLRVVCDIRRTIISLPLIVQEVSSILGRQSYVWLSEIIVRNFLLFDHCTFVEAKRLEMIVHPRIVGVFETVDNRTA